MSTTQSLYRGPFLGINRRDGWEFATRTNASAVVVLVPLTREGKLLLVEQFRHPVEAPVIELPAGLVGDQGDRDEPLEAAAARELEEETGYCAGSLEHLLTCPSSAGLSDEIVTFLLATDLERTGPGGGDESEDIMVHEVAVDEVPAWLSSVMRRGCLVDPKIYSALFWLARRDAGLPPLPKS